MIPRSQDPRGRPAAAENDPDQTSTMPAMDLRAISPPKFPISNFQLAQIGNEVILIGSSIRGTPVPNKDEMVIQNEPCLQIILSLSTTKDLAKLLAKCVTDYEAQVGQIPTQSPIKIRMPETKA